MDEFKVLIADDSRVYRKLLEQQLFALGSCSVLVARSGQEAIEIFEKQRPALVITDWVMPDLSGIELCQKIRAMKSDYTYIIILTRSYCTTLRKTIMKQAILKKAP